MDKKEQLIAALEHEYQTLPARAKYGFGNNHLEWYPPVIEYLKTGVRPKNPDENNDLLWAAMDDFDTLCSDYGIKDEPNDSFTLFWLDGKSEIVHGKDIADAMTQAGYGQGAVPALDFHGKGDLRKNYVWVPDQHRWIAVKIP